jgi:hypothetical protein
MFGLPGIFKLLMEPKGLPLGSADNDDDSVEMTEDTARAYVVTMLAVGAGNSNISGFWGASR